MEERLNKVLRDAGVASRRHADELIEQGRVKVNGTITKELGTKVNPRKDTILVDGERIKPKGETVYFLLNKPAGFICSKRRLFNEKLVYDLLDTKENIFSIGRLDKDTKGLLLLTNDGQFAQTLIHPSSNITKEYLVKVKVEVTEEHLKKISSGVYIDGRVIKPVSVVKLRRGTLKIVVKEGKKHEIKKFLEKADLPLYELKRTRIGNLHLGKLPEGGYRILGKSEMDRFFDRKKLSNRPQ